MAGSSQAGQHRQPVDRQAAGHTEPEHKADGHRELADKVAADKEAADKAADRAAAAGGTQLAVGTLDTLAGHQGEVEEDGPARHGMGHTHTVPEQAFPGGKLAGHSEV